MCIALHYASSTLKAVEPRVGARRLKTLEAGETSTTLGSSIPSPDLHMVEFPPMKTIRGKVLATRYPGSKTGKLVGLAQAINRTRGIRSLGVTTKDQHQRAARNEKGQGLFPSCKYEMCCSAFPAKVTSNSSPSPWVYPPSLGVQCVFPRHHCHEGRHAVWF